MKRNTTVGRTRMSLKLWETKKRTEDNEWMKKEMNVEGNRKARDMVTHMKTYESQGNLGNRQNGQNKQTTSTTQNIQITTKQIKFLWCPLVCGNGQVRAQISAGWAFHVWAGLVLGPGLVLAFPYVPLVSPCLACLCITLTVPVESSDRTQHCSQTRVELALPGSYTASSILLCWTGMLSPLMLLGIGLGSANFPFSAPPRPKAA